MHQGTRHSLKDQEYRVSEAGPFVVCVLCVCVCMCVCVCVSFMSCIVLIRLSIILGHSFFLPPFIHTAV